MDVYVCTGAHKGQKRLSDPLELQLEKVVHCLMWVLGNKTSLRAASALNP